MMFDILLPLLAGIAAASFIPGLFDSSHDWASNDEDDTPTTDACEEDETEIDDEFWLLERDERGSFVGSNSNDRIQVETETGSQLLNVWYGYEEQNELPAFEVRGGEGDDTLSLSGSGYYAYGDGGSDLIELTDASNVAVYGGDGDTIVGGTGSHVYVKIEANSIFIGGAGNDYVHSSSTASVHLGDGNDVFVGLNDASSTPAGSISDIAFGGAGDDYLVGGLNEFHLRWAHANDQGYVSLDQDTLYGGTGNDTIVGSHSDLMIGGDGDDRFELVLNQGVEADPAVISDFNRERDFLEIRFGTGDGVEYSPEFYNSFSHESFNQSVTSNGDTLICDSEGRILVRLEGVEGVKVGFEEWNKDTASHKFLDLQGNAVNETDCSVIIRAQSGIFN